MSKDADGRPRSERVLDDAGRRLRRDKQEIAFGCLLAGVLLGVIVGWLTCPC